MANALRLLGHSEDRGQARVVNEIEMLLTHRQRMAHLAREFVLEFVSETGEPGAEVIEERIIRAMCPDDAAREAAFRGWPQGARVCRIADPDGRELASVARFL